MKKQVVVIGLGRFGSNLAKTLYQMGHDVLAIDQDEKVVQEMVGQATYPVTGDATSEAVLRELGVPNFDTAIVAIGSDIEVSIMTTVLLKSLGLTNIVARARNNLHGQTLERVGATRVIYPEQEMGIRVAHTLFNPDVIEYMELTPNFGLSKIKIPDRFADLSLNEAGLGAGRDKYGVAVLAVKRGKELTLLPAEEERLKSGDILIVAAKDEQLDKLRTE